MARRSAFVEYGEMLHTLTRTPRFSCPRRLISYSHIKGSQRNGSSYILVLEADHVFSILHLDRLQDVCTA
jgi:hypothetical protein